MTAEARVWLGASHDDPDDDLDDEVGVASRDSFPASDPPAWAALRVGPCARPPPPAPSSDPRQS